MNLLLAGLLAVNLAVTLWNILFSAPKIRRQAAAINVAQKAWLAEEIRTGDSLREIYTRLESMQRLISGIDGQMKQDILTEATKQLAVHQSALTELCDGMRKLTELMLEIQAGAEEESRTSRALEEGFSNIMSYSVGQSSTGEAET